MSRIDNKDILERIEARLKATGKSSEGASRAAGLSRDYIRNLREDKSGAPKIDKLMALAQELEASVGYLVKETDDPTRADLEPEVGLPIMYETAAGNWAPVDHVAQTHLGEAAVTGSRNWPFRQWLERVRGDSFDRKVPDGALVHVIDATEMGYQPRHGDVVIVTRTQHQGSFVERTMKQVHITHDGKVELRPQSHNPKHEALHLTGDADDTVIQIVGRVVRAYVDL